MKQPVPFYRTENTSSDPGITNQKENSEYTGVFFIITAFNQRQSSCPDCFFEIVQNHVRKIQLYYYSWMLWNWSHVVSVLQSGYLFNMMRQLLNVSFFGNMLLKENIVLDNFSKNHKGQCYWQDSLCWWCFLNSVFNKLQWNLEYVEVPAFHCVFFSVLIIFLQVFTCNPLSILSTEVWM